MFRKFSVLSLILATASASSATTNLRLAADHLEHETMFHDWMQKYHKVYDTVEEKVERFAVWMENHAKIEAHNLREKNDAFSGVTLGHNPYSDMTQEEFHRHFRLGDYAANNAEYAKAAAQKSLSMTESASVEDTRRRLQNVEAPLEVDWRALGGVTPVKNQGSCGSCWSFSTTGALEGAKFINTGELVSLSEQNLLDCDHLDMGCNGGLMDNAFKFDEKTGGLCSEEDYPYEARVGGVCNPTNCEDVPGTIVSTFYDVPEGDLDAMVAAASMQPIAVAIQADQFVFQFYKGGVLTDDSCGARGAIDHGVLLTGYGIDPETQEPFFNVKNSWGDAWGEDGYIRMSRNSNNQWGMCAILKMASFPEVVAPEA